jgi:hypothetical protein
MEAKKISSIRDLGRVPFGNQVKLLIKKLVILLQEQPEIGRIFLQRTNDLFEELIKEHTQAKEIIPIIAKNQYIAIVGYSYIEDFNIYPVAKTYGFSKSNIKTYLSFERYKSGEYNNSLESEQCIAVIFGAIPHKSRGGSENKISNKSVYARTKSGELKLNKESLSVAFKEIKDKLIKSG